MYTFDSLLMTNIILFCFLFQEDWAEMKLNEQERQKSNNNKNLLFSKQIHNSFLIFSDSNTEDSWVIQRRVGDTEDS